MIMIFSNLLFNRKSETIDAHLECLFCANVLSSRKYVYMSTFIYITHICIHVHDHFESLEMMLCK